MRNYLIGATMVAITLLVIFLGMARADPPPNGWTGTYTTADGSALQPIIVCKTAEQVKTIYDVAKSSGYEAAGHKAVDLYSDNEKCISAVIEHVTIVDQTYLGEARDEAKGQTEKVWSVHISTKDGDRYCYYEEVSKEDPA